MDDNSSKKVGINVNVPDDVVRGANEFLQRILGPIANAADLLSDKLRLIRFRSALKTLRIAKELAENNEIPVGQVPTKFLVPFLENCSVEDEESDLIRKWAALLVSAAQNEKSNLNWCIRILAEIDGRQARVLDSIYSSSRTDRHSDMYTRGLADGEFHSEVESLSRTKGGELQRLVGNWDGYYFLLCEDDIPNTNELHLQGFDDGDSLLQLESLGLLWVFSSWVMIAEKRYYLIRAFISPLGCSFVEACSDDKDLNS
jgi:hypothetical protein